MGEFDVHYGAIGSGVREGTLVKVIGTSTCDCGCRFRGKTGARHSRHLRHRERRDLARFLRHRGGQSAVGDIFKWWVEVICQGNDALHGKLTKEAEKQKPGQSGLLALDWNNGNRTILVNPMLSGLLLGQTLHTSQTDVYRALIEATAFGARAIIERIKEYGVPIERVICAGGIAEKKSDAHANLRRRYRLHHAGRRFEPGLRARLRHRCRRSRRCA